MQNPKFKNDIGITIFATSEVVKEEVKKKEKPKKSSRKGRRKRSWN